MEFALVVLIGGVVASWEILKSMRQYKVSYLHILDRAVVLVIFMILLYALIFKAI